MNAAALQIRMTPDKGRGLFAAATIPRGSLITEMRGQRGRVEDMPDDCLAMQIDDDLWLYSVGDLVDDCGNHSCNPNAGFITGQPVLYALHDIAPGEEICWDYSTSISIDDWSLDCRCGAASCRGVVRPWGELTEVERSRLREIALEYLRRKG